MLSLFLIFRAMLKSRSIVSVVHYHDFRLSTVKSCIADGCFLLHFFFDIGIDQYIDEMSQARRDCFFWKSLR